MDCVDRTADVVVVAATNRPPVPFPIGLPDFLRWAWRTASPGSGWFAPGGDRRRRQRRIRTDWLWGLLRLEVVRQRSNRIVLADEVLARARWDSGTRPRDWRVQLTRLLDRVLGEPPTVFGKRIPFSSTSMRTKTIDETPSRKGCPKCCPLYGSLLPHRHFLVRVPAEALGVLHDHSTREDLVESDGSTGLSFHYRRFRRGSGSGVWSFYLPPIVLGRAAGLSPRQVRLLVSIVGEVTRSRRSHRRDKATVHQGSADNGLPLGRWVPCQGNGSGGYTVEVRGRRCGAWNDEKRPLTKARAIDLLSAMVGLEDDLGVVTVFDLDGSSMRTREILAELVSGRLTIGEVVAARMDVWIPHDYVERWRRWLGERASLVVRPYRKDDVPVKDDLHDLRRSLRRWIVDNAINVTMAATKLGTSAATLYAFLAGSSRPRRDLIARIVEAISRA